MNIEPRRHFLVCLFLFQGLFLFAHDVVGPGGSLGNAPPPGERFAFRNRTFEMSTQVGFYMANNAIAYGDFFQSPFRILRNLIDAGSFGEFRDVPGNYYVDRISINLGDFFNSFVLNFGLDVAPLSININVRDRWGFGLDLAHVNATGNLSIPGNVLSLREAEELFGMGGAVFLEFGIPVFFHARRFRVSLRPAAYIPVLYVRPGITYRMVDGHRIELAYDMRIFSPFSLEGILGAGAMENIAGDPVGLARNGLGYDISLGVEYPVLPWLSVGVRLVNIPLPFLSARLDHYARLEGSAFFDSSNIDFGSMVDGEGDPFGDDVLGFNTSPFVFGTTAGQTIRRPFTMLLYANYRLLGSRIVSLVPSLGFSINNLYARIASPEGGLSARFDFANFFVTTVGINYNDRRWRNSLDFALNLRLLEIGVGLSMQSPEFVRSFQGTGFGVSLGVRTGW